MTRRRQEHRRGVRPVDPRGPRPSSPRRSSTSGRARSPSRCSRRSTRAWGSSSTSASTTSRSSRAAGTLSGGEAQRIRLATQIGSGLVGVLYVLDEPSIGLHQRDNRRLIETLTRLRDLGNTLIVVEHDEDTIRAADWIVDIGPGAGEHGGRRRALREPREPAGRTSASLTGAYVAGRRSIEAPAQRRAVDPRAQVTVVGAREHNLRDIDVSFPLGVFTAVTGVSGSGKSTLVNTILYTALANTLNGARQVPGRHTRIDGHGEPRQGRPRRPGAHRPHPALQPRDVYGGVGQDPQALRRDRGGAAARVRARALLLQRQGRAMRGVLRATGPSRSR